MSSNFAGCCCFLVSADEQPAPTNNRPCGSIVELTGMEADVFPGLYKVETITTNFAMVTCHSLIPDSDHLNKWKFSESFLGPQGASVNKFVCGMISCCGEKSFLTPGPTTAGPHGGENCNLGLNCTVLFLNEEFEQIYTSHYGSPPSLDVSPCNTTRTISLIHRYLDLSRDVANADNELEPDSDVSTSSGSFEIITMSSNGRTVSLSAIERESASRSETELAREITKFQQIKVVKYNSTDTCTSNSEDIGMPLLYVTPNDCAQLVGVLIGEGKATILSAFFQLLQGNPAACLSLLINTEARRLWIHKWSHLLLPYLASPKDTRRILEILIILRLVKRTDKDKPLLYVNTRDDPKAKLGFLKLLQALFLLFSGQARDGLTTMTAEVCTQAKVPLGDFLSDIRKLCESLSSIARDCCDYQNTTKPEIKPIVEHCFLCANEMLNFQHEQDVVEKVLCSDDFESTLNRLHENCQHSRVIPTSLVSFYRKMHTQCKEACKAELISYQQKVNELETKCSELRKQIVKMEKERQPLRSPLEDASSRVKCELKDTVDQTQQLQSGKESQFGLNNNFNNGKKLKEVDIDYMLKRDNLQKKDECLKYDSLQLTASDSVQFSIAPLTVQEQANGATSSSSEANLSGQDEQNTKQNTSPSLPPNNDEAAS